MVTPSRLLPKHSADLPAPDHPASTVEQQPRTDDRQRRDCHALGPGDVPDNVENDSGSDQAHGTEDKGLVGSGCGGPKFIQHHTSITTQRGARSRAVPGRAERTVRDR